MKTIHISIDDIQQSFIDIIEKQNIYKSIFDSPLLGFLQKLHTSYNAKFSLYSYTRLGQYKINDFPVKFKDDFKAASSWLKIGFHWSSHNYDASKPEKEIVSDCDEFYNALQRFAGNDTITTTIRLHYFHPSSTLIDRLCELSWFHKGITLLCADSSGRLSYDLTPAESGGWFHNVILTKNQKQYIKTDFRLENLRLSVAVFQTSDHLTVFTHEWAMYTYSKKEIIRRLIKNKIVCPFIVRRRLKHIVASAVRHQFDFI